MDTRRKKVSFDAYYFGNSVNQYNMSEVFEHIYQINLWGSSETKSGEGSTLSETSLFASELCALLGQLAIKIMLDAPCGAFNWLNSYTLPVEKYIGIDVLQHQIKDLKKLYYNNKRYEFLCSDISKDVLPKADLILCRDCLVHFSFDDVRKTIANFKKSGSTYLLATTFTSTTTNENIVTGDWQPLNLEILPFCFPKPLTLINEGCTQNNGLFQDKSLALWRLSDL